MKKNIFLVFIFGILFLLNASCSFAKNIGKALIQATENFNTLEVKRITEEYPEETIKCINGGISPEESHCLKNYPLHFALFQGHQAIVKQLVDLPEVNLNLRLPKHPNPDHVFVDYSPLDIAIENMRVLTNAPDAQNERIEALQIIKTLIGKGAKLDSVKKKIFEGVKYTSFQNKKIYDQVERLLLKKNNIFNAPSPLFTTLLRSITRPFCRIVQTGRSLLAKVLLRNYVSPKSWINWISLALRKKGTVNSSQDNNNQKTAEVEKKQICCSKGKGKEILDMDELAQCFFEAISKNNEQEVKKLIFHYPELIKIQTKNCVSPLCWAISHGHEKIITVLLEKGADSL